jgi:flagellar basal body-associated protein FliL
VSETETPKTNEAKDEADALESVDLAELANLEPFPEADSSDSKSPRLKEYLSSNDAPSRYLMVLSFVFGFLAISCFVLLLWQYLKHRHHEQKIEVKTAETVKIEPSFHQPLGEYRVQWDDAEMRADLNVECSTQVACDELKNKYVEAHDLLLPIFQASSRSEMLNPNQKTRLRQALANKLNELKLQGEVREVDITDLSIEPHKL